MSLAYKGNKSHPLLFHSGHFPGWLNTCHLLYVPLQAFGRFDKTSELAGEGTASHKRETINRGLNVLFSGDICFFLEGTC